MNSEPSDRAARERALSALDARLREEPLSIELTLDRARLLADLDRPDAARDTYLRVLARAPDHVRALNDFGAFLLIGGFRAAARTVIERALAIDPQSALAHTNLGHVRFADTEYDGARRAYEAALAIEPERPAAHQGLSYALTRLGLDAAALHHRRLGFAQRALTTAPFRGAADPVDVLVLVCAAGGTLYTDTFLDDRIFRTTTLVADLYASASPPPATLVFNAISDADRAPAALAAMERLFADHPGHMINHPARVSATGRVALAARLGTLAGVIAPRAVSVPLAALCSHGAALAAQHGFTFPLLVRAPGYHTGQYFERIDTAGDFAATLAAFPGQDVLLIDYADLRAPDGTVRKYRMMTIDGELYPLHVAIARSWKVHYFSADMATDAAHRAQDARFLAAPEDVLGGPAMAALRAICAEVGLEYSGIDFGIDAAGRVVVFEANATMIVLPPGPNAMWDYRRAPVARIVAAVRAMLLARQ